MSAQHQSGTGHDEALATIAAGWHERPRCAETNRDGTQCARTATWHVSLHGHSQTIMCTQHLNRGRRWVAWLLSDGEIRCRDCGHTFTTVEAVIDSRRL